MKKRIKFLGAAKNVTGSRYLVQAGGTNVLVDCGMHQERHLRDRDFKDFPVPPSSINAVLLTHAHLDHCGYLPKLVREGFRGKIYGTPATCEVARIVLLDSAFLQEEDVKHKRKRHRRGERQSPHPYEPLYTVADAEATLSHFEPIKLRDTLGLGPGVSATLRNAGHILGSASIRLELSEGPDRRTVLFSGDVGRFDKPIIRDPVQFSDADYVVVESTYGDREHGEERDILTELAEVINDTVERGGNVVIPSFAVERAHEVIYHLNTLMRAKRIPRLMTFLDSPMALAITEVFERHPEIFDEEMNELISRGQSPFNLPELVRCRTADESRAINTIKGTVIIIAGSGMCTGGRVKHHLVHNIEGLESTILFVGYQASGTLGRQILERPRKVRIFGLPRPIGARIARIRGFSAHADRQELADWLAALERPPRRVFVTHGDEEAAESFAQLLSERLGCQTTVPEYRNEHVLD